MSHIAESIPTGKIRKIENYINKKGLTLREVLRETGASWALNSIMYNPDGSPCSHLKADGKVIGKPAYNAWGLAWDEGPDIHVVKLPNLPGGDEDLPEKNYVGGAALVLDGKQIKNPVYAKAQGGRRGRTAYGIKPGRFCADLTGDGTQDACTPEQLGKILTDYGWQAAIMGDCGGSSQGVLNGREIRSSRIVRYLLLVYLDTEPPKPAPNPQQDGGAYEPIMKCYSRKKDGGMRLGTHFKVKEFACNDGSDPVFVSPGLVQLLEAIRAHFGKPVNINSGYRTPGYNKKLGGAQYSQHMYGTAADIVVKGVSPETVGAYARSLMPHHGGVGIYKNFTHVDVRSNRADWRG